MLFLSVYYPADENLRFFDRAVVVPSEGNGIITHEIIRTQGACSRALAFFVGIGFLREMRYIRVMDIERESSGVRYDTDEWKINRYSYKYIPGTQRTFFNYILHKDKTQNTRGRYFV